MLRYWCLLVAVSVAVTATTNNSYIPNCKCQERQEGTKIFNCSEPLTLTSQTFKQKIKKTQALVFSNVSIVKIEKDAFAGFNYLQTIAFTNSQIDVIDPQAFVTLRKLIVINFTGVKFGQIPTINSIYIETLKFTNCGLKEVPNLNNLNSLMNLFLDYNNISKINELAFAEVEYLEEIFLNNNNISELPLNIFEKNEVLNTLTLDNNPLKSFNLRNLSSLESLTLKNCKLETFSQLPGDFSQLYSLDLSNNNISVLPIDAFVGMFELNFIDLSYNQLVELDDNIFEDNPTLEKITMDGNRMEMLPNFQTSKKPFNTYNFSCNNCSIKKINNSFANMPGILVLQLANNRIEDIEGAFDSIKSLKELNLAYNNITKIDGIANNTALETLNLSTNPLKPLDPVVFTNLKRFKKLDVSNSNLTKLWANYNAIVPSLKRLLIRKNNLSEISVDDLKVSPKLKLIDLEENPLVCNDNFHDVITWLITHSVYPIQGADKLKTHDNMLLSDAVVFEDVDQTSTWKTLDFTICGDDSVFDYDEDIDKSTDTYTKTPQYLVEIPTVKKDNHVEDKDDNDDYMYDNEYDYIDEATQKWAELEKVTTEPIVEYSSINLTRASYILSVTSVFVLTAIVVLTAAVTITLFILKKNGAFNMQNGNLPRLKIPLWQSQPTQKKHSGSVYRTLSEDLSGPRTPMINRYEFKATPAVHITLPN